MEPKRMMTTTRLKGIAMAEGKVDDGNESDDNDGGWLPMPRDYLFQSSSFFFGLSI